MIATEDQARDVIASIYGRSYAESTRFVMRSGFSIMILPTWAEEIGLPILAWRRMESSDTATVWLGRYLGYEKDAAVFIDWNWHPEKDEVLRTYEQRERAGDDAYIVPVP